MNRAAITTNEFNPELLIWPFCDEPEAPSVDISTLPQNKKRKFYEEATADTATAVLDEIVDKFPVRIEDKHKRPLFIAVNFHLARLAYKQAFGAASMQAQNLDEFQYHFKEFTSRKLHLPFTKPKGLPKRLLEDAYRPAASMLPMESGALAVAAYFCYYHSDKDIIERTGSFVVHRLRRAVHEKKSLSIVRPDMPGTRKFIDEILDIDNSSREPYLMFAKALQNNISYP